MGKSPEELIESLRKLAYQGPSEAGDQGRFYFVGLNQSPLVGPIGGASLKKFVDQHELPSETKIRDIYENHFVLLYEHPYFQRRKKKVELQDPSRGERVYCLKDGGKSGPFQWREIYQMVVDKDLLLIDMVSFDDGKSWVRLCEFEEFDRRRCPPRSLPATPGEEMFEPSDVVVQSHEDDAIFQLAFLENVKSGKTAPDMMQERGAPEAEIEAPAAPEEEESSPLWKYALYISLCLGTLVLFLNLKISWDNGLPPPRERQDPPKAPKVSNYEAPPRQRKRAPAAVESVQPDEYEYDDGSEPVERDPVRHMISKETLHPDTIPPEDEARRRLQAHGKALPFEKFFEGRDP